MAKLPQHKDPVERLRTAQHEMSHAILSYALEARQIQVAVFDRPKKVKTVYGHVGYSIGCCTQNYLSPSDVLFVSAGAFASQVYTVDETDQAEFNGMVNDFIRLTGKSAASFRYAVLDPVKNLLDSGPAIAITNRLAPVLARGGLLTCPLHTDMEKFFPSGISITLLRALCRDVREAAKDVAEMARVHQAKRSKK